MSASPKHKFLIVLSVVALFALVVYVNKWLAEDMGGDRIRIADGQLGLANLTQPFVAEEPTPGACICDGSSRSAMTSGDSLASESSGHLARSTKGAVEATVTRSHFSCPTCGQPVTPGVGPSSQPSPLFTTSSAVLAGLADHASDSEFEPFGTKSDGEAMSAEQEAETTPPSNELVDDISSIRALVGNPVLSADSPLMTAGEDAPRSSDTFRDSLQSRIAGMADEANEMSAFAMPGSPMMPGGNSGAARRFRFPQAFDHLNGPTSTEGSVEQIGFDEPIAHANRSLNHPKPEQLDEEVIFQAMQETIELMDKHAAQLERLRDFEKADAIRVRANQFRMLARQYIHQSPEAIGTLNAGETQDLPMPDAPSVPQTTSSASDFPIIDSGTIDATADDDSAPQGIPTVPPVTWPDPKPYQPSPPKPGDVPPLIY